jgi:antitoxin PrlF
MNQVHFLETSSTLTSKGQATIPAEIRKLLALKSGDRVGFLVKDNEVILVPLNKSLSDLKNILPKPSITVSIEEMNRAIEGEDDSN